MQYIRTFADASRAFAMCLCGRTRVPRLPPFPLQKDNVVFICMNLDDENKAQIIASMWRSEVKAGVAAVKQGDLGDCLYVIAAGEFVIPRLTQVIP
jgi:CRP-like cAMP-binding protein